MNTSKTDKISKASFSCKTNDLLEAIKFLKAVVPKNKSGMKYTCEITIKTNLIELTTIGAKHTLYCNAGGPAKVSVPLLHLYSILKDSKDFSIQAKVGYGFIELNSIQLFVWTSFLEDDTILRSVDLPINFTPCEIIQLPEKYTEEEIEFNNLGAIHSKTYQTLMSDIKQVHSKLKKYGFTPDEVESIIRRKIQNQNLKKINHEQSN